MNSKENCKFFLYWSWEPCWYLEIIPLFYQCNVHLNSNFRHAVMQISSIQKHRDIPVIVWGWAWRRGILSQYYYHEIPWYTWNINDNTYNKINMNFCQNNQGYICTLYIKFITVISWHSNNMLACQWVNHTDSRVFSETEFTFANKTKFKKLTTTLKRRYM